MYTPSNGYGNSVADPSGIRSCSTCVQLTEQIESMGQEAILFKTRNKILVTVNRALRERLKDCQESADAFIESLYVQDQQDLTNLADVLVSAENV
jgi:hypothetical protein